MRSRQVVSAVGVSRCLDIVSPILCDEPYRLDSGSYDGY